MKISIKERRESLGLSKYRLAEMVGVHRSTIGRIEDGKQFPSTETLQRLAEALKVSPSDLVEFENEKE
jgi:transcriptional regulator with XRE-family HTH domain